jgi:hypothetical protein
LRAEQHKSHFGGCSRHLEKKAFKLVAVALANKLARIAFAILRARTTYNVIAA